MGTSRSPAQFVGKINKIGHATDRSRRAVVNEGAFATKTIMLAAAAAKGVTPGGKIAGRKWGVSYDLKGQVAPTALVRFTGPFHLVNNPTKPHYIAASGLGGSRASRGERAFQASANRFQGRASEGSFGRRGKRGKRAVLVNGSPRAYVFHPGTSGKAIYPAAKVIARRTVPNVMANAMKGAWKRALT